MVIKDSKKMKITEEPPELDRLSDLPDTLLLHILSFLNTQYTVQTSVLAKRWKLLWTFLPDLHLQRLHSYKLSSFEKFVINVFSRRRNSTIRRLRFLRPGILFGNLPSKVCDYAMWHGVQHLNIGLGGMAIKPFTVPSELFTCPSLETLELRYISIYVPSAAGPFSMPRLAVLRLHRCEFRCWFKDPYVLIGGCPNLATLSVESSSGLKSLKISAQQLVDLTIVSDSSDPVSKIEVDAPKLKNYSCTLGFIDDMQCCSLKGPTCLENVFLDLDFRRKALQNSEKAKLVLKAVNVLQGVGSVQFLTLSCRFFQVLEMAPVVLVRQPSPFSRLKMLQFQHSDCETLTVSALLVLYFLKACPRASVDLKFNKMKTPLP